MTKALGMIETKGLIGSITAADAMIKSADVRLVKQEQISAALVTIFVEGDVSAVIAAVETGKVEAKKVGELLDSHVIPHPDNMVRNFLNEKEDQKLDMNSIDEEKLVNDITDSISSEAKKNSTLKTETNTPIAKTEGKKKTAPKTGKKSTAPKDKKK